MNSRSQASVKDDLSVLSAKKEKRGNGTLENTVQWMWKGRCLVIAMETLHYGWKVI